jgi:hypothetical protein
LDHGGDDPSGDIYLANCSAASVCKQEQKRQPIPSTRSCLELSADHEPLDREMDLESGSGQSSAWHNLSACTSAWAGDVDCNTAVTYRGNCL